MLSAIGMVLGYILALPIMGIIAFFVLGPMGVFVWVLMWICGIFEALF